MPNRWIEGLRTHAGSLAVIAGAMLTWRLSLALTAVLQQQVYAQAFTRAVWAACVALVLAALTAGFLPPLFARCTGHSRIQSMRSVARAHVPLFLYGILAVEGSQPRVNLLLPWLHLAVFGSVALYITARLAHQSVARVRRAWSADSRLAAILSGRTPAGRWGTWGLLAVLTVIIYAAGWSHHSRKVRFDNGCEFGGDVWEYQSIGVNFARGHGFPTFGGQEDFSVYAFGRGQEGNAKLVQRFYDEATEPGRYFYRTPGYPLFLGMVYRFGEVSPLLAKRTQLRLLVLVAALLPLVGFAFWRWHGFAAGLIGGQLYLQIYRNLSGLLITENLVTVWVLLLVIGLAVWHRYRRTWASILLGVIMGTSLMVKGWFVLVPIIWAVYAAGLLWQHRALVRQVVLVGIVAALTVAPWSTYASLRSGRFILLATQGENVLLQGNNEEVERTGGWQKEGPDRENSFYRRNGVATQPGPLQVAMFYADSPAKFPLIMMQKMRAAFGAFVFWRLAVFFVALDLLARVLRRLASSPGAPALARAGTSIIPIAFGIAAIGLLEVMLQVGVPRLLPQDPNYVWWLLVTGVILTALTGATWTAAPAAVVIVFLNFVLMTLVTFGLQRFIWPLECLDAFIAVRYGLYFAGEGLRALLATEAPAT